MILEHAGFIELPPHAGTGGFDHAATHRGAGRLYVAHTANDAVDIIDCVTDRYLYSVGALTAVAGVLAAGDDEYVFTSNRGEDTVAVVATRGQTEPIKLKVGHRPNGLAFDPVGRILLAANVGDAAIPGSMTASIVDIGRTSTIACVPLPGRTRWAVFSEDLAAFFINIADPPSIVVIEASNPAEIAKVFDIPAAGPHGLDLDAGTQRLFCACDANELVCLNARTGAILGRVGLSGSPDAIFFNAERRHLYVAIGDPGLIDVVDTDGMRLIETVRTERGAHTIGFDAQRNKVYAFLPGTHRAAIYRDLG